MMKRIAILIFSFCALATAHCTQASEELPQRRSMETRSVIHCERCAAEEQELGLQIDPEADLDEVDLEADCDTLFDLLDPEALTALGFEVAEEGEVQMAPRSAGCPYATPFPDVSYHLSNVKIYGDMVELCDGSQWEVNLNEWPTAQSWDQGDVIRIYRPWSGGGYYPYLLYNACKRTSIAVKLTLPPDPYGILAQYVYAINYNTRQVVLMDTTGLMTTWKVTRLDGDLFRCMLPGDNVIIGTNDDWTSLRRPSLLIITNIVGTPAVRAAWQF